MFSEIPASSELCATATTVVIADIYNANKEKFHADKQPRRCILQLLLADLKYLFLKKFVL